MLLFDDTSSWAVDFSAEAVPKQCRSGAEAVPKWGWDFRED
jgi:hypothetical protein